MATCFVHPERPSEARCAGCARDLCSECLSKGEGLCMPCMREKQVLRALAETAPSPADRPSEKPSKAIAFFLSFCPGLGHWYLGLEARGLYFIVSFFGIIAVLNLLNSAILGLVLAPLWLYAISDAMWAADEILLGTRPKDNPPLVFRVLAGSDLGGRRSLAWGLVLVGALSLLNNLPHGLIPERVDEWIRGNLLGTILTGAGVWLLLRQRRSSESEVEDR